jgi:DNA/RNA endonuclease YhcR with UshA esterase domain
MNLLRVSLIISIVGIFLLLFLANTLQPRLTAIEEINDKMINKKITIKATIFRIADRETFKILSVKDETGKIDVLCDCQDIKNNQEVTITGKVKEYNQYLQIQADKIIS